MARKNSPVEDLDLEEDFEDFDEDEEAEAKPRKRSKKAEKADEPKGIGAREMAEYLEMEPKTFRAWLRRKVENEEIDFGEREAKQRYNFGADFDSPEAQAVIQLHAADKVAAEERKAAREAAAAAKAEAGDDDEAPKRKAPAKKAPAKKAAKKS